ncbi:MAG: AEC family transporter [Pseudomonadota bacterium]
MSALSTTLPTLYATITPVYFVVAVGFAVRVAGLLTAEGVRALATYVATVAAPAMVFHTIATNDLDALTQPGYLAGYTLGSMLAFFACYGLLRTVARTTGPAVALGSLGAGFGNSLMIGFPLASLLFGDTAAIALALTVLVEAAVILPLALTLADLSTGNRSSGRQLARNALTVARNPLFIAMVLGALVAGSGIALPATLDSGLGMLARTVAPVGLFVIGGLIVGYSPAGDWSRQGIVVCMKLCAHPLGVFVALLAFGVRDPNLIGPALCFAASPIFGAYAAISQRYNLGRESAAVMISTTLVAALSMPLVLWGLGLALAD